MGCEVAAALSRAAVNRGWLVKTSAGLSVEAVRILTGRSTVAPAKGDGRFADPAWEKHPGDRRLKQLYQAPSKLGSRRDPVPGPAPGTYVLEPA